MDHMDRMDHMDHPATKRSPLIIGGVPKSGTRVYQRLATLAGYRMYVWPVLPRVSQANRVASEDCRPMAWWFYPKWIDPYLANELTPAGRARMRLSCEITLRRCDPLRRAPWGWKNPRSIFLVGFFADCFRHMRFLHVVRDPRDVVFHPTHPLDHHQESVMTPDEIALPEHLRRAVYWQRLNELGEKDGPSRLGNRYLLSRLEDLGAAPRDEVIRVLRFMGVGEAAIAEPGLVERGIALIESPGRASRPAPPAAERAEVEDRIGEAMAHYGYR
jgi:hypothetical protein